MKGDLLAVGQLLQLAVRYTEEGLRDPAYAERSLRAIARIAGRVLAILRLWK